MRNIKQIVIHCTATDPSVKVETILNNWKRIGWKSVGYNILVDKEGIAHRLASDDTIVNGTKGFNYSSIHISYIGGIKGEDTRTEEQKETLSQLIYKYHLKYPDANIVGHRDLPNVKKLCPSFDVSKFLIDIKL